MILKIPFSSFNNKFIYLKKSFANQKFRLLDIGAGNHSAIKTKKVFPLCEYHGLDMAKDYNNSEEDFSLMKSFYEIDLTKLEFSSIPENYFDAIWMVHVIEHLYNGDEVIQRLLPKLKKQGYLYIEYPGQKSTRLPSMNETLNFYDDPTHVRIYSTKELSELFRSNNCKILKCGTRRNIWYMMAMPFRIFVYLIKRKKIPGNVFWDILGFAEFLWVQKK